MALPYEHMALIEPVFIELTVAFAFEKSDIPFFTAFLFGLL